MRKGFIYTDKDNVRGGKKYCEGDTVLSDRYPIPGGIGFFENMFDCFGNGHAFVPGFHMAEVAICGDVVADKHGNLTTNKVVVLSSFPVDRLMESEGTMLEIATRDGGILKYVKEPSAELQMACVATTPSMLSIVKQTKELCLCAVSHNGKGIRFAKRQGNDVCRAALMADPYAIKYIRKPQKWMYRMALDEDWHCLSVIGTPSEEICLYALEKSWEALQYMHPQTDKVIRKALSIDRRAMAFVELGERNRICLSRYTSTYEAELLRELGY